MLTTDEMDFWLSFQEVVPAIERVWARIGGSGRCAIEMHRAPLSPAIEARIIANVATLDRVVVIARSAATVRFALLLRLQMNVHVPLLLYVYGDAIEGFESFGALADHLTGEDVMVVSCEAEAVAVRCCFPTARFVVIPFPLVDGYQLVRTPPNRSPKISEFAYVGRVSEQKNLHILLFALWILRTRSRWQSGISVDVYGADDGLGTPHSAIRYSGYWSYLKHLAQGMGVDEMVTWHGFKPRAWLFDNVHTKPHIFVTPSLHSDENFGSSLLASLVNGHQAVATAWGGHLGFAPWFPDQIALVPVQRSTLGPVVDPVSLAVAMRRASRRSVAVEDVALDDARAAFSERVVATQTLDLLSQAGDGAQPLVKSTTQRRIDEQRASYGGGRRAYSNYADPVLQRFFEAYGMSGSITFDRGAAYVLAPWVSCSMGVVRIDDPHRGQQTLRRSAKSAAVVEVTLCPSLESVSLPADTVEALVGQGYAFAVPSDLTEREAC